MLSGCAASITGKACKCGINLHAGASWPSSLDRRKFPRIALDCNTSGAREGKEASDRRGFCSEPAQLPFQSPFFL
jgi:hypothetical protein